MASPELVKYFHAENLKDELNYIEDLEVGKKFIYRKKVYQLEEKLKKNYLCVQLESGKKYAFKPLARVEKLS